VPLELAICEAAAALRSRGTPDFHGYQIAKTIGDAAGGRLLTAYGTLYRALGRLERMGLLTSRWEDPAIPARENRPGRRLYVLTALGDSALDAARRSAEEPARSRRRLAPA
jgi:PadR family transcriptional regulator, regulatory protein PadR